LSPYAAAALLLQVRAAEMPLGTTGAHSWHVLRGFKHSAGRVENSMRASMHILQGSFDPIMDANNNTDLLPLIIQAKVGWAARCAAAGGGQQIPASMFPCALSGNVPMVAQARHCPVPSCVRDFCMDQVGFNGRTVLD
jgi:hypothetical protein